MVNAYYLHMPSRMLDCYKIAIKILLPVRWSLREPKKKGGGGGGGGGGEGVWKSTMDDSFATQSEACFCKLFSWKRLHGQAPMLYGKYYESLPVEKEVTPG